MKKKSTFQMSIKSIQNVDNVDNLAGKEIFSDINNISGSHSYQQVIFTTFFLQKFFDFHKRRKIIGFCSENLKLFFQIFRAYT